MAETAKERIARLLREKKSAGTKPASNSSSIPGNVQESKESGKPGSTVESISSTGREDTSEVYNDNNQGTSSIPEKVSVVSSGIQEKNQALALKLMELERGLTQNIPDFPFILKHIHDVLKNDPEIVTILSDEEKGLIVQGLIKHTDTTIVAAPKKSTKKSQPISLDMLD